MNPLISLKQIIRNSELNSPHNGWANYATWNVALWIQNDESLYNIAKTCSYYSDFADKMQSMGEKRTPDGIAYGDCLNGYGLLDVDTLDSLIKELNQ